MKKELITELLEEESDSKIKSDKLKYLKWWDILILTIILLGGAILSSNLQFFQGKSIIGIENEELIFTTADNIMAFVNQSIRLIIAILYLYFRKFDFSQWKFKITFKESIFAIAIFIIAGAIMDFSYNIAYGFYDLNMIIGTGNILEVLKDISLIVYSILNGIYEEIYFLGICLAVRPEHRIKYFIFSLLIRFSFHTYQGLFFAIAITLILGIMYYYLYSKKNNNLYPYFLSHAIADIFGISIIAFLRFI